MTCPTASFACLSHDPHIPNTQSEPMPAAGPARTDHPSSAAIAANPLERLAQLVASNDLLMDELTTSRARIVSARSYLDRPGCNVRFGSAHLERCRDRHSGVLAQLRANRIEALRLLGEGRTDA